jgi:transaldolase
VNTLPPKTLQAFRGHRKVRTDLATPTVQAEAARVLTALAAAGIDLTTIAAQLEREGVALFAGAFDSLLQTIRSRSAISA